LQHYGSSKKELCQPDEMFYDENDEYQVFANMKNVTSSTFLHQERDNEEALTVATSVVDGVSNNS